MKEGFDPVSADLEADALPLRHWGRREKPKVVETYTLILPVFLSVKIIVIIIMNAVKGATRDFFTISSLGRELSPTRAFKWPGSNRVQITWQDTCNMRASSKGQLGY